MISMTSIASGMNESALAASITSTLPSLLASFISRNGDNRALIWLGLGFAAILVVVGPAIFFARRYRRCPSNRILVIFGRVGSGRAARCMHGGGALIWPMIQDWAYLSLEPMVIDIPLSGALSLNNIRVNSPATFTVGVSTDPVLMNNAAERLLNFSTQQVRDQAQDIILGQLRLVIATLTIEEINKDREKFMKLINENVAQEINKIGLELINVNVRDITDESGYIEAIGKRAAAEAINRAKVEVAQQERDGAMGEAKALRDREVSVSMTKAGAEQGKKEAESQQRAALAALEAQAVAAEVSAQRDREVNIAQRQAEAVAAKKAAEQEQRVRVADAEATAVTGENLARAKMAQAQAQLGEVEADSRRRREVASAKAMQAILIAEREQERISSRRRRSRSSESRSLPALKPRSGASRPRAKRTRFSSSSRPRQKACDASWRRRPMAIAS
jgi:flotillin